jgi:hypothetical protein
MATVAVMCATAWATYQGFLTGVRDYVGSIASTAQIGGNDLVALLGFGKSGGPVIGTGLFVIAVLIAAKARLSVAKSIGGFSIGCIIAAGWVFTFALSTQVFEPIQTESLSFVRPSANAINLAISGGEEQNLSLDTGLFFGIFVGALISSLAFQSFKLRTFGEPGSAHILRYLFGGILMGFGGIVAVGCTIGAGFTGGSVLAISSLLGLVSMMISCGLTDHVLNMRPKADWSSSKGIMPAE